MNKNTVLRLPKGIGVMCVSEEGVTKDIGGTQTRVLDYSISVEGPGEYALGVWDTAKKTGHGAYAKLQLANTWEMAVVPCVPAFEKVYRHLRGVMTRAHVDGAMLGWTLGGFPSPTLTLAKCFFTGRVPTPDEAYAAMFPGCDTAKLKEAFRILSDAFDEYPFHIHTAYLAPHLTGAANLLYDAPTHRAATMVGYPYDDIDSWRGIFPEDTFIAQLKKLCDGWDKGVAALEEAAKGTKCAALTDVLRYARVCACQFGAAYDQSVFVKRRNEEGVIDTDVIAKEMTLAKRMLLYVSEDPTIGYESSNHYFFTRVSLLEKLVSCDCLLRKYK